MLHPISHVSLLNFRLHFENRICIVQLCDNNNLESLFMDNRIRIQVFALFVFLISIYQYSRIIQLAYFLQELSSISD